MSWVSFSDFQKRVLCAIIVLYIAIIPILHIKNTQPRVDRSKAIYVLSKSIAEYHDFRNARIASQVGNWGDDLFLSYYLGARYFGKVRDGISDIMLKKKLEAYNIQYYLVHGELRNKLDILKPDKKFGDITIYKIVTPKKGSNAGIEVKG